MPMKAPETLLPTTNAITDLPTDALIICATRRLAQTLTRAHDTQMAGSTGWQTLRAMTLSEWLHAVHEQLALRGQLAVGLADTRVLNNFQEQLVWEQIIHAQMDASLESLFDLRSLTASAIQAHKLSIEWNIPIDGAEHASEEQRQFRQWDAAFRAHCQKQGLIDGPGLQAQLIDHLSVIDRTLLPNQLCFAGFDHYTAQEQKLQKQLQTRGVEVSSLSIPHAPGALTRVTPVDLQQECLAIAAWAKNHLRQNPACRLGIVAPDLEAYRHVLQDALEDTLTPDHILASGAHRPRPFNISLGQPLGDMPIVHCALTILNLISLQKDIEQHRMATLLHSPYWSNPRDTAESDARARLDAAYRASVALKAPLSRYDNFAAWFLDEHGLLAPALRQHLHAVAQAAKEKHGSRLPSEWRRYLESLLGRTGWLAEGKLNSLEFQTREAFIDALSELSRLDAITEKLSFREAVQRLSQICSDRLFQPKTTGHPPIQILGVLESTGLTFDALWLAGLTETNWPPPAHPNPFLSIAAQRQQHAPNACASVQLDFAQRIQHRLLRSAPEITLSAPCFEGDTELQPSALIAGYAASPLEPLAKTPWFKAAPPSSESPLEAIEDAAAPPVTSGAHVRGGTWLLRAQAICPAWGYYQYRLGAIPLQEPVEGLDARQRGTLVHDALELFWLATRDSESLRALVGSGLNDAIYTAIDGALEAFNADKKHEPLKPRQHALERERLHRLLHQWLLMEAARPDPFTAIRCEHEFKDNIGGIEVRMFIDRIDQLSDGRLLIIDYKTGASIDTRNWASARLTEPQLPIYAAIAKPAEGDVAGVAFGLVHLSKLAFKGIGDAENVVPGVEDLDNYRVRKLFTPERFPDWSSVLEHWRTAILTIAEEVCVGDASVRYANDKDLMYCDVLPLLRLTERQQQFEAATSEAQAKVPS